MPYPKLPYYTAVVSAVALLISSALYSISGASTGYIMAIIAVIIAVSAYRIKRGKTSDISDASLTILFFGLINIFAFFFMLSEAKALALGYYMAFPTGFIGAVLAVIAGISGYISTKKPNV